MLMRKYKNQIHLSLSKDLEEAIFTKTPDKTYLIIIYTIYLISFGALFIANGQESHLLLIYALIPSVFLPIKFEQTDCKSYRIAKSIKFSFYNIFRNVILCRTPLFLALLILCLDKAFLSYLYPEPTRGYIHIFFYYLMLPLISFVIVTIRLSVDLPCFYYTFFWIMSPLCALNALINLFLFVSSYASLREVIDHRFFSQYGAAMGYNPNLDALIYAIFLVGLIVSIDKTNSKYQKFLNIFSLTVLFVSLLLTQSRASLLSAIFVLFMCGFKFNYLRELRFILILLVGIIIFIIFVLFVLPGGYSAYLSRIDRLRPELWLKFFYIIKENYFIGVGDRTTFTVLLSHGDIAPHPHNILLSALLRGGIIGLASMLFILIAGLYQTISYAKITHNLIPFSILLLVTIAGFFDFDLKIWQAGWYLATYWLAIAFALGADSGLRASKLTS